MNHEDQIPPFENVKSLIESTPLANLTPPRERKLRNGNLDPFAFVDACESARDQGPAETAVLEELQRLEFLHFLKHLCVPFL